MEDTSSAAAAAAADDELRSMFPDRNGTTRDADSTLRNVPGTVRKRRGARGHARHGRDLESSIGDEQLQPLVDRILQGCGDLDEVITNRWIPRVRAGAGRFRQRWRVLLLAALLTVAVTYALRNAWRPASPDGTPATAETSSGRSSGALRNEYAEDAAPSEPINVFDAKFDAWMRATKEHNRPLSDDDFQRGRVEVPVYGQPAGARNVTLPALRSMLARACQGSCVCIGAVHVGVAANVMLLSIAGEPDERLMIDAELQYGSEQTLGRFCDGDGCDKHPWSGLPLHCIFEYRDEDGLRVRVQMHGPECGCAIECVYLNTKYRRAAAAAAA